MQIEQHSFEMGRLSFWLNSNLTEDQRIRMSKELPAISDDLQIKIGPLTPHQKERVMIEIRAGQKIAAIKLVREFTGWQLKEAKEYVDNLS